MIGKADAEIVSGLGRFRFDSVGNEQHPREAEGMFTRGTTTEWEFGAPRVVEMYRLSDEESAELRKKPGRLSELAVAAFNRHKLEPGRTLSEGRVTG